MLDIREMIRRFRMGHGDRQVARDLKAGRNSVRYYREWAKAQGYLDCSELPEPGVIEERFKATSKEPEPGPPSSVEPYREFVIQMRSKGVERVALKTLLEGWSDGRSWTSTQETPTFAAGRCRPPACAIKVRYHAIRNILRKGLDAQPLPQDGAPGPLPKTSAFARSAAELLPKKKTF